MKMLLIGGTGFIGPRVCAHLQQAGHSVTVFHRGTTGVPRAAEQIKGDRNRLQDFASEFGRRSFDVVIDLVLSSERQAAQSMETFRGITGCLVALSSMDVYRAWGVFYRSEPGGLQELPVTEDSAVRTNPQTYPPEVKKRVRQMLSWVDDDYDKVPVERVVLNDKSLPGTVLRLPMIYGPGDYSHRFHPFLKRMDDGRPHIIFADDVAALRTPRGYVDNVAAAIALAATSPQAAGRIYNVCEMESFSELEWAKLIGATAGWRGRMIVLPHDKTPAHLRWPGNTAQHLVISSERIRKELGYREHVPRDKAIRQTIEWERSNPPAIPMAAFDYAAEDAAVKDMKASA